MLLNRYRVNIRKWRIVFEQLQIFYISFKYVLVLEKNLSFDSRVSTISTIFVINGNSYCARYFF